MESSHERIELKHDNLTVTIKDSNKRLSESGAFGAVFYGEL